MKRLTKAIFVLIGFYAFDLSAQQHIQIEVSSNRFTPNNVVIQVGDTVTWTNVQGFHNVNGSTNTFPNNPDSFRNNVAGPGWKYTFVFTKSGSYDYLCDPHASFMQGAITVEAPTGIRTNASESQYTAFPNPVKPGNTLELIGFSSNTKLYGTDGRLIPTSFAYGLEIPIGLTPGLYTIIDGSNRKRIVISNE